MKYMVQYLKMRVEDLVFNCVKHLEKTIKVGYLVIKKNSSKHARKIIYAAFL